MDLSTITEVRTVHLRSTGMSDFELCPRKFLFRHRAGLVPRSTGSPALARGDIFHRIIASILVGDDPLVAERKAHERMEELRFGLAKHVGPAGYLPNGSTPEEAAKALESNTLVAIAMSRAYRRFHQVGTWTIAGLRVLEGSVEVPITAEEDGRLDCVVVDRNNHTYVLDHKTCSWNLTQYARTLPLSAQTLIYPRLLTRFLVGLPGCQASGICYCIIKTPSIRCSRVDDFSLAKYAKRVEEWYEENPNDTMLRTFIRPSHELIKLSVGRLAAAHHAAVRVPNVADFPGTGGSACQAYNTLCPYLSLCTTDTARWPQELARFDRSWRDDPEETD